MMDKKESNESSSNGNISCRASIPRYSVNNEKAMAINLSWDTLVFLYADIAIIVKTMDRHAIAAETVPAIRSSCVTMSNESSNGLR